MNFAELRASIPAATSMIYMNTGWAGPSPRRVLNRMAEAAVEESRIGPAGPDGLANAQRVERAGIEAVARLLNVGVDDVLLTHGTTEGVNIVLGGLDWGQDAELLTTDLEHPAIYGPSAVLAERRGVQVRRLSFAPDASADEVLTAVRDGIGPRTKLVALSHVMFTCGLRLPARELVETVRDAGALVLLDGAQTGGQLALDLAQIDPDFYTISGQKWLMGPGGSGALYIRRDRQEQLAPLFTGPGLDSRTGLQMHSLTSQSTVVRAGFAEAVALNLELGPERVEAAARALGDRLRAGFAELPHVTFNGPTHEPGTTGLTAISAEGWEPPALAAALWERHRIAARAVVYPPGVRFSTAPFNDERDVDRAVEAMAELAG